MKLSDVSDHRLAFEALIFILGCIHNGELPPAGMCEAFSDELSKRCFGTDITKKGFHIEPINIGGQGADEGV